MTNDHKNAKPRRSGRGFAHIVYAQETSEASYTIREAGTIHRAPFLLAPIDSPTRSLPGVRWRFSRWRDALTERYPDSPGHCSVDTSVAAAETLAPSLGRLQRMALQVIRDAGSVGCTADELAAALRLDRWTVQPRTSELRRKGMIHDSGQRRQNVTGKRAIVWTTKPIDPPDSD
jgi:hypothetical protein